MALHLSVDSDKHHNLNESRPNVVALYFCNRSVTIAEQLTRKRRLRQA